MSSKLNRQPGPIQKLQPAEYEEVLRLVASLTTKAQRFLALDAYEPPTPDELTAVRRLRQTSQREMAQAVESSRRLWNEWERNHKRSMPKPTFAMLTLFVLRDTPGWRDLVAVLAATVGDLDRAKQAK